MSARPGLKEYLDGLVARFESEAFIQTDPVSIPLGFDDPRDREVIGLYAALLAWGRRETILAKMGELCERMKYRPYRFVRTFRSDNRALDGFGHRTFLPEDARRMTAALSRLLESHASLEAVFLQGMKDQAPDVGPAIQHFSESVMSALPDAPARLQKHLARPQSGSACKRLSMYLRWMVRPGPVDMGIWQSFSPAQLVLPLDVHSGRQARALGLLTRKTNDWRAVMELTEACREFSPEDPCRYDFALFGAGAFGEPLDPRFVL